MIFDYVVAGCDAEWAEKYQPVFASLRKSTAPVNSTECPPSGTELSKRKVRELNDLYEEENGKSIQIALSEAASFRRQQKDSSS